ncbi:MAG: 7-cyano-7-deazaguanine synthase [Candidatus Marinimicrobia bacterium]|nr:7-cyano-7-deazaguanine synthase [Candidatus Neomarinimicrobiota bacterium]
MEVVSLVSGGIDSLLMCKLLAQEGIEIHPLFVDYGQLSGEKEWAACQKVLYMAGFPKPIKISLKGFGKAIRSGITNPTMDIYEEAFLPGRNLLLLVVAASYAFQKNIKNIAIGLLSEETHMFPDQTGEFIVNTNFAINSAFGDYFTIITPLMAFSKKDVIKLAKKYNLPLEHTYSCHSGNDTYCGKCVACREIIASGESESLPQFNFGGE